MVRISHATTAVIALTQQNALPAPGSARSPHLGHGQPEGGSHMVRTEPVGVGKAPAPVVGPRDGSCLAAISSTDLCLCCPLGQTGIYNLSIFYIYNVYIYSCQPPGVGLGAMAG